MVVQKMYKYRLYPSHKQKEKLINSLITCKTIYNKLLELSIIAYKLSNVTMRKFDYCNYLSGSHQGLFSQVVQNVSDRVHKSFQNFFRRVKDKSCKEKGFPRFKSRVNSITYPQYGFKLLSNKRLHLSKIGNVPIILHRIPKGKIKTLTIKQNKARQWFAIFACELPEVNVTHPSKEKVGIDVGIERLATLSTGEKIDNPRWLVKSEKKLQLLHRRLSRKKKGSANRRKARFKLSKQYLKVSNQRDDFLHKISHNLVKRFSLIAVENLNIKGMVKNHHLAKHINDASWSKLIHNLEYKAVTSGSKLVKVNPRNTSKTCNSCGEVMDMPLSKRMFKCSCGYVCDRDLNASLNILVRADCPELNACEHNVRPSFGKAVVDEAGTICNSC